MILSFSVANFRSFGEETSISFVAGSRSNDHVGHLAAIPGSSRKVLRTSVLYGANGAGKSNLYRAMQVLRDLAIGNVLGVQPSPLLPFKFWETEVPCSRFEIVFASESQIYRYRIEVSVRAVCRESLEWLRGGVYEVVYERAVNGRMSEISFGRAYGEIVPEKVRAQGVAGVSDTRSFLALLCENVTLQGVGAEIASVYRWFRDLQFIGPESIHNSLVEVYSDDAFRQFAEEMLEKASGVHGLRIRGKVMTADEIRRIVRPDFAAGTVANLASPAVMAMTMKNGMGSEIQVRKNPDNTFTAFELDAEHDLESGRVGFLDLGDESDGTKRLIHLLPALYRVMRENKVCVIDEVDRSMHALLSRSFLRKFLGNPTQGQLILTTQEDSLLDAEIFRRDEVWFAEKDSQGMTRLYSLNDYRVRTAKTVRDYYFQGRYGAIPTLLREEAMQLNPGCRDE